MLSQFWIILFSILAVIITFTAWFIWFIPHWAWLRKEQERLSRVEEKAKVIQKGISEAIENIKAIESFFDIPIYEDGLPSAPPPVFELFAEGLKLMTEYRWEEAIGKFRKAMKEAKINQLITFYYLLGNCYYMLYQRDLAIENWKVSLKLARDLNDKQGEAVILSDFRRKRRDPIFRACTYLGLFFAIAAVCIGVKTELHLYNIERGLTTSPSNKDWSRSIYPPGFDEYEKKLSEDKLLKKIQPPRKELQNTIRVVPTKTP